MPSAKHWKSASFLPRKLEQLHRLGPDRFFERKNADGHQLYLYSDRLYRTPGNGALLKVLVPHLVRYARLRLGHLFFIEQWILLFDLADGVLTSLWRFKKLIPPKDRF